MFRIHDKDSIMCGFYCIAFMFMKAFIAFILLSKNYTNLFLPNGYKKNDKIVYKYFMEKYVKS